MWKEMDDLVHYVNLFGYNPKYGVSGSKISSVKYLPQGYERTKRLYET
jgi:DNA polymerase-3 subunit epsilon